MKDEIFYLGQEDFLEISSINYISEIELLFFHPMCWFALKQGVPFSILEGPHSSAVFCCSFSKNVTSLLTMIIFSKYSCNCYPFFWTDFVCCVYANIVIFVDILCRYKSSPRTEFMVNNDTVSS